jgi:hypothetical protein
MARANNNTPHMENAYWLVTQFLNISRDDYGIVGTAQRIAAFQSWTDVIRKEADLKWIDKPKTPDEEGDVAG